MKRYKIPLLSKIASWIAFILPQRVRAWIWIAAWDSLNQHMRWIHEIDDKDRSESYHDVVTAIRIETLRRGLFRDYLKATIQEDKDKK